MKRENRQDRFRIIGQNAEKKTESRRQTGNGVDLNRPEREKDQYFQCSAKRKWKKSLSVST